MSDDCPQTHDCLDAETLAAFIDGRLESREREVVEAHLAECEDCYEVWMGAGTGKSTLPTPAPERRKSIRLIMLGTSVAAAAMILLVLGPLSPAARHTRAVAREVGKLIDPAAEARPVHGFLSIQKRWQGRPSPTRSGTSTRPPLAVEASALALRYLVEDRRSSVGLHGAALAALVLGDVDSAIAALEEAHRLSPDHSAVVSDLSATLFERWLEHREARDLVKAVEWGELAVKLDPDEAAGWFNRAQALTEFAPESAIPAWEEFRRRTADPNWEREATERIERLRVPDAPVSAVQRPSGADRSGLTEALSSLIDKAALGGSVDATELAFAKGAILNLRFSSADDYVPSFAEAVLFNSAPSCAASQWRALSATAQAYDQSDYITAERTARELLKQDACVPAAHSRAQTLLMWALFDQGQRPLAAAMAPEVLDTARRLRSHWDVCRAHWLVGRFAVGEARLDDGLDAYASALAAARETPSNDGIAGIETLIAEVLTEGGDPWAAWPHHISALTHFRSLTLRRRHIVLTGATHSALASGLSWTARLLATQIVTNAQDWGNSSGMVTGRLQQARAALALGDRAELAAFLAMADESARKVASAAERERYRVDIAVIRAKTVAESNTSEAIDLLTDALQKTHLSRISLRDPALLLERSRLRRVAGDSLGATTDLASALSAFENQDRGLRAEQLRVTRRHGLWDIFEDAVRHSTSRPAEALALAERARARALLDAMSPHQSADSLHGDELHNWLPERTSVVSYWSLTDSLLIWHVSKGGISSFRELPVGRAALAEMTETFLQHVKRGPTESRTSLEELLLPGDDGGLADSDTVWFIPDGPLHQVPFSALRLATTMQPLVARIIPVVAPSLSILAMLSDRPRLSMTAPLLVGYGAAYSPLTLPALPDVDREIDAISSMYLDELALSGDAATSERLTAEVGGRSIVHIAGHALADDVTPARSRLILAPSRSGRQYLLATDVAALELRPGALVILSACDTIRGRVYRGEGSMNIARAFLVAGASHVVGTLWPVRDDRALELLKRFHERLKTGASPAEALALAQRDFIRRGDPASVWAVLGIVGLGTQGGEMQ